MYRQHISSGKLEVSDESNLDDLNEQELVALLVNQLGQVSECVGRLGTSFDKLATALENVQLAAST